MKKEKILVVCAHSDDQILGPGGTIAKYAKEGKDIHTIILSYGIYALPWLKEYVAKRTRIKEANDADKVIGGKGVVFFDLMEGKFNEEYEEKKVDNQLASMIRKIKPTKIFTHSFEDPHPDHKATYEIVKKALKISRLRPDIFLFDIWNPISIRKSDLPRMYVDISDSFKIKIKALKCFPSQWSSMMALTWNVYLKAIINGFHIHKRFGERFVKVK